MQRNILRTFNHNCLSKRFYKKQVRVRFAPSPTGYLHLGGLRTALYNYLFARSHNGSFLLRIEDTDQTRIVPGAIEKLHEDLLWAGIIPDEDPIRGGPAGPYIQSKRLEIYKEKILTLLNNKSAYYCFCTESRLNLLRREANKNRQIPKYDNRCRHLTSEEVKEKFKKGQSYCIRFRLTSDILSFNDMVYGDISHDISQNEGDPVILKSDGYPTYHFANVVDDYLMEISHVLRGVEWQISTPKHLMLYKAFGWNPPVYGHLPLILNNDGSKLSKRQDDIKVESYRKDGIFPLALVNYIVHAGGGFEREQGDQKLYSYANLIKQFNIYKVNAHSTKLDPLRLQQYNKLEISNLIGNEKNHKFLIDRIIKIVLEATHDKKSDGNLQLDDHHVLTTLKWAQNRITNLKDLVSPDLLFLWILPNSVPNITDPAYVDAIEILSTRIAKMNSVMFLKDEMVTYLRKFSKENNLSFPTFMKILRNILSGLKEGPSIGEMIEILGKEKTLYRLKRFINQQQKNVEQIKNY